MSLLQLLFISLSIYFLVLTVDSFNEYGWIVNQINPNVPVRIEENRIYFVLFTSLYILVSFIMLGLIIKNNRRFLKINKFTFFINFIFIPYYIHQSILNSDLINFKNYYELNDGLNKSIDHKTFFFGILNKKYRNKLFFNTLIYYITLLIFVVGMILLFLKPTTNLDPMHTFIIDKLSYFTNISNILCFLYLSLLLFFNNKTNMKKNIYLINLSSYIVVVGLIYWCYLMPVSVMGDGKSAFGWARAVWLHTATPISFVVLSINSYRTNKNKNPNLLNNIAIGAIYPAWYGMYIYSLPFLARVTIYGFITNPNPYMILADKTKPLGHPAAILCIVAFGIFFILFFTLFNWINKKKYIK